MKDIDSVDAATILGDSPRYDEFDERYIKMTDSELLCLTEEALRQIFVEEVLIRIEALNPDSLSDYQKELLGRWGSFFYKDAKTNVPHLLEMLGRLVNSQFLFKRETMSGTFRELCRPLGGERIIKSLNISHFQGSEAAALEESDNFAFEFPVQDGLSTKRLEVRIRIGKDPIDKSILALASLSEITR